MVAAVVTLSRRWGLSLETRCRFKSELLGRKETWPGRVLTCKQQQYRRSARCAVLTPVQNALQALLTMPLPLLLLPPPPSPLLLLQQTSLMKNVSLPGMMTAITDNATTAAAAAAAVVTAAAAAAAAGSCSCSCRPASRST